MPVFDRIFQSRLPLVPLQRIKSLFAMKDAWTLEETVPYLRKFIVGGAEKDFDSKVASLLGKHARVINLTEKDGEGKEVSVARYVAKLG